MSLLLDALKRAEEANKAGERGAATPPGGEFIAPPEAPLEAVPIPLMADAIPTAPAMAPTSKTTAELSLVEEPVLATAVLPSERRESGKAAVAPSEADVRRDAVRNAFAVKQRTQEPAAERRRVVLAVTLGVLVLAVAGGGGWYLWRELNKLSRPAPPRTLPSAPSPAALALGSSADGKSVNEPLPPLLPPPAKVSAPPPRAITGMTEREAVAADIQRQAAAAPVALQWRRADTGDNAAVAPTLAAAYAALQAGQLATAQRLYTQALAADPGNADVHLGLATIAARNGERELARQHYARVLDIDPANATAAGALAAVGDGSADESGLRALIARTPDVAALHFALGNKLAAERRWVDAQEAYFEAARLESANADFAFNLAISLDHLGQHRAAVAQYRRALSLAPGHFDARQVQQRILELADR